MSSDHRKIKEAQGGTDLSFVQESKQGSENSRSPIAFRETSKKATDSLPFWIENRPLPLFPDSFWCRFGADLVPIWCRLGANLVQIKQKTNKLNSLFFGNQNKEIFLFVVVFFRFVMVSKIFFCH